MERQLIEEPPADRFLASYFAAREWWSPPMSANAVRGAAGAEEGIWESPLPDVTD
jgi:hypothetical protein